MASIETLLQPITCPHCKKPFRPRRVNQKYCSETCRKENYRKHQKEYYQQNKNKIKQQQKRYREKKKMEKMEEMMKLQQSTNLLCKLNTNTIKLYDPIKNYHYNGLYKLWTITTITKDTYFIYTKNIKKMFIKQITDNNEKTLVKVKNGKIIDTYEDDEDDYY